MGVIGFFILGFIIAFFGGIYLLSTYEIFDIYDNEDEKWD